jgi:hypothetical protein
LKKLTKKMLANFRKMLTGKNVGNTSEKCWQIMWATLFKMLTKKCWQHFKKTCWRKNIRNISEKCWWKNIYNSSNDY